jgi:hypothetical protein
MSNPITVTATRADGGIALMVYAHEGNVMRLVLDWRRAALLGLDQLNLAVEPRFRAAAPKELSASK